MSPQDHRHFPRDALALHYRRRWTKELELRDIKASMDLTVLHYTKPEWVRQALWTGLFAYNLIRLSMR